MRVVVAVTAVLGAVALAGCTGGSDGTDRAATSSGAPGTASSTRTVTGTPSTSVTLTGASSATVSGSASATGSGTAGGSATISPPPAPSVPSGHPGAFALTTGGTPITGVLTSVDCRQDGSMTADQLTLSPGAASVTLTAQPVPGAPVTIAGSAALDAAGGTFRGADSRGAITVVWTC